MNGTNEATAATAAEPPSSSGSMPSSSRAIASSAVVLVAHDPLGQRAGLGGGHALGAVDQRELLGLGSGIVAISSRSTSIWCA